MVKKAKLVLFLAHWSETVGARTFTNCCSDSNASFSQKLQTISGKFDGAFVYNDFVYTLCKWEEIVGALVLVLRSTSRKINASEQSLPSVQFRHICSTFPIVMNKI